MWSARNIIFWRSHAHSHVWWLAAKTHRAQRGSYSPLWTHVRICRGTNIRQNLKESRYSLQSSLSQGFHDGKWEYHIELASSSSNEMQQWYCFYLGKPTWDSESRVFIRGQSHRHSLCLCIQPHITKISECQEKSRCLL